MLLAQQEAQDTRQIIRFRRECMCIPPAPFAPAPSERQAGLWQIGRERHFCPFFSGKPRLCQVFIFVSLVVLGPAVPDWWLEHAGNISTPHATCRTPALTRRPLGRCLAGRRCLRPSLAARPQRSNTPWRPCFGHGGRRSLTQPAGRKCMACCRSRTLAARPVSGRNYTGRNYSWPYLFRLQPHRPCLYSP